MQEACFALQPGEIVRGQQGVRQSLSAFIDMKGKLELLLPHKIEYQLSLPHMLHSVIGIPFDFLFKVFKLLFQPTI
jgi:hypothetical protein